MGGIVSKPDFPVKFPYLADALANVPADTVIYYTLGNHASDVAQPEQAALVGDLKPAPPTLTRYVAFNPYVNIRKGPSTAAPDIGDLPYRTQVLVRGTNDPSWMQIAEGPNTGAYVYAAALVERRPA